MATDLVRGVLTVVVLGADAQRMAMFPSFRMAMWSERPPNTLERTLMEMLFRFAYVRDLRPPLGLNPESDTPETFKDLLDPETF